MLSDHIGHFPHAGVKLTVTTVYQFKGAGRNDGAHCNLTPPLLLSGALLIDLHVSCTGSQPV